MKTAISIDEELFDTATIDKTDLKKQVTMLPKFMLDKVNNCLKLVMEIN